MTALHTLTGPTLIDAATGVPIYRGRCVCTPSWWVGSAEHVVRAHGRHAATAGRDLASLVWGTR